MTLATTDVRAATTVRLMTDADCDAVAAIISQYATVEVLLWRTAADIRKHLSHFLVAEWRGRIIGCVGLRSYGKGLYEVRSLAVLPEFCGQGLGTLLVQACLEHARDIEAAQVFALTRRGDFFRQCGFVVVPRERFPQKVWLDCQHCWKRSRCDEVAMLVDLAAERAAKAAAAPPPAPAAE